MNEWTVRALLFLVAVVVIVETPHSAQDPQPPAFRTRVDLVPVDVAVHRGGRPVVGLAKANFEVLDNGVPQTIQQLLTDNVPVEVWLVLDVSSSVQGQGLVQLRDAASAFVDALAPHDRAGLVCFSHDVLVSQPLTGDLAAIRTALGRLRATGATAVYDAAYIALQLRRPNATRGVLVVLTDGADNASWLTGEQVLEAARRTDLVLYGIGVNETNASQMIFPASAAPRDLGDLPQYRFLRGLAAVGAGAVFDASFATLRATFTRVLAEIRARYLLAYSPTNPTPGWHTLEVKLKNLRGDVLARRGYWAVSLPTSSK